MDEKKEVEISGKQLETTHLATGLEIEPNLYPSSPNFLFLSTKAALKGSMTLKFLLCQKENKVENVCC